MVDASIVVADRTLHIDRPEWRGKTTLFNLIWLYPPDGGRVRSPVPRSAPRHISSWRRGSRLFQITNLFPALTVQENLRLAFRRDGSRFNGWSSAARSPW